MVHYSFEDGIVKSVPRDHCLSSSDLQDGFFYLTLTLMVDTCKLR